jgi:prepilin-type N-terminal cleavage/methylation domain-containing protein
MKAIARSTKNVSGFSLVELMVVVCMIGILAAIAIPAISSWLPNYRLRSAARNLYTNLQRAKMGAIKNNAQWRVYFDNSVSPGRYFLLSGPGIDGAWDTPTTLGGTDVVEKTFEFSAHPGVDYGNGDATTQLDGGAFGSAIDYNIDAGVPTPPAANFTPRGTVNLFGYVYLTNAKGTCYAVGTPSPAGIIDLRRWSSGAWQ